MKILDAISGREIREGDWVVRGDGTSYRLVKAHVGFVSATVVLLVQDELCVVPAPLSWDHPQGAMLERVVTVTAPTAA